MKKDIVILAAGIGKRLLPYTMEMPKCLVEINNKAIIENILDSLLPFSDRINKVLIVVGYKKDDIIEKLKGKYKELKINYIINDIYRETNNIYSLWLTGKYIKKDLILFESDVFFDHEIIKDLFNTDKNIALVDEYESFMEGTALEIDSNSRITNIITKKRHQKLEGLYKTLNLYHFTGRFFLEIFLPTLEIYMKTHSRNSYYEVILKLLVFIGQQEIYAKNIEEKYWYEIDDMEDLRNARYLFSKEEDKIKYLEKSFGGYWNYKFKDFNLLYNDYFPCEDFKHDFKIHMEKLLTHYPSNDGILLDKTRKILPFNLEPEHIIPGNGSCQIIKEIFKIIGKEKVLVPVPTFGEYTKEEYNLIYFYTEEDNFLLNTEKLISLAEKEKPSHLALVNPNNPTSLLIEKKDIIKLLKKLDFLKYIIIDESFMNFSEKRESAIEFYKDYKNLIIVKSFGKEYGIPGIRYGCAITSNEEIIKKIKKSLPIWNINSFVEYFLERFGKYKTSYEESLEKIMRNKKELAESLEEIKEIKIIKPSETNFLLCSLIKGNIKDLQKFLFLKYKILIKIMNKKGFSGENYFRVSVRSIELNKELAEGVGEYINYSHY